MAASFLLSALALALQSPIDEPHLAQQAGAVGTILFALDRAAWISTDALMAKVSRDSFRGPGGYVIERMPRDRLRVTYYRGEGAAARAFYVAEVANGKVRRDELLRVPAALTPAQSVLAAARDAATAAAQARGLQPCTAAPFNSIVVPSSGGSTTVYLMSAQVKAGEQPIGGHYRMVVAPDGRIQAERPFSRSCLNMGPPTLPPGAPPGAKPVGVVVSSVLDAVPTEMHVFSSLAMGVPLYVVGKDGRMWKVAGRTVEVQPLPALRP